MEPRPALLKAPPEVILSILSYLDLPDLAALVKTCPELADLAGDPVLHQNRVRFVAPSRVQHSLFGVSPRGLPFRPTVGDLINRDVIRGLGIERRWRMGAYFYSHSSIKQYENGLRLARRHASDVISFQLRRRSSRDTFLNHLHVIHVLPDVESSSIAVSAKLLPVIRQLKWSLQRDKLSRVVRSGFCWVSGKDFGTWREQQGQRVVEEGERVRLAVCPDIKKVLGFYERLGRLGQV